MAFSAGPNFKKVSNPAGMGMSLLPGSLEPRSFAFVQFMVNGGPNKFFNHTSGVISGGSSVAGSQDNGVYQSSKRTIDCCRGF